MTHEPAPHWQPIGFLPKLASMIDGTLEGAEAVYQRLQQAHHRPQVWDDYTVGQVREVYGSQLNDLWVYEEQLARWQQAGPTPAQHQELDRLMHQLDQLRSVLTACLTLTEDLKESTIERVLGKSDIEAALDVLSGKLKL